MFRIEIVLHNQLKLQDKPFKKSIYYRWCHVIEKTVKKESQLVAIDFEVIWFMFRCFNSKSMSVVKLNNYFSSKNKF